MAARIAQEKEAQLSRLKRKMEACLETYDREEYKVLINEHLSHLSVKQAVAPHVDKDTLKHVNKIIQLINTFEKDAEEFKAHGYHSNKVTFLKSVIQYLEKLNLLVLTSKLSDETSTLIDIDAIRIVLQNLAFDINDTACNVQDWRNSRVASKRYANMRPQFLYEVLMGLTVCVGRQKRLMEAGLLYKAVADQDLAAVIENFHPSLANVPSRQMPSLLFRAVETGDLMILDYLAERCDITSQTDANYSDYSILHYAARCKAGVIETLFANIPKDKLPAIINLKDRNRQTPLHVAAACDNYDVVQILCKRGACYNLLNIKKETPAFLSRNNKKLDDFFKILQQAFHLARLGKAKELGRICKESEHNGRAVLNAEDGTGMSARKILMEKVQRQN